MADMSNPHNMANSYVDARPIPFYTSCSKPHHIYRNTLDCVRTHYVRAYDLLNLMMVPLNRVKR